MFALDAVPAVSYADPWHLDLPRRLAMLSRGAKRVAYFYEQADNSTFRYRVYNMAQVLNAGDGGISASYFFLADLGRLEEIADAADLLVICRTRYDHRVAHLVAAFRRRGKRVLFDVDDFVFDTDYAQLIQCTLDQDLSNPRVWDDWFAYSSRLGATLKLCDGAIATNENLARRLADFAQVPTAIVPNFINREQLELSERVYAAKRTQRPGAADGLIHLGYFSGSPSHNRDFAIVAPLLEGLLEDHDELGLVVVGYIEAGALQRFGPRVRYFPFHDFVNLQRLIGSVEFNLMPLQYNAFTNCKSELKYFEAAIVGTQSIASPTFTYGRAIRDGDNGYLAQAHQWREVIERALAEVGGYQAMAARAYDDARAKYAWFNQRACIAAALGFA